MQERVKLPAVMGAMAFLPGVTELVFLSTDSQKIDCVGCRVAPAHEEDMQYAMTISNFPVDLQALRDLHARRAEQLRQQQAALATEEAEKGNPTVSLDDNYYLHTVVPTDTLAGLQVRYDISAAGIRKANPEMVGDIFKHLKTIRIPKRPGLTPPPPVTESTARKMMIRDFECKARCTQEEAKYYLSESDFDLESALRNYREDQAFDQPTAK